MNRCVAWEKKIETNNNALYTAEGTKYKNPGYLVNRIKETEAKIRQLERYAAGKLYHYSEPKEISEKSKKFYAERINEETDKLNYLKFCLEQVKEERPVFDKETLSTKTEVLIRKTWVKIVRLNPKTISVLNTCFPTEDLQKKYALKYNYGEVKDAI